MIEKTEKSSFESYLLDAANISGNCEKVLFPENKDDIIEIFKQANMSGKRITISAARTGLNGGSVPNDGFLLSTEKLNSIKTIDEKKHYAIVEPGVLLKDLQEKVEDAGLFYPPDPTETNCSIGGTVANNASGARTFKYGPTRNFVDSISLILPDGSELDIERGKYFAEYDTFSLNLNDKNNFKFRIPNYKMPDVKHAAGYYARPGMDLIDLFIGSEGTLGFISEIKLKLLPLPQNVLSMIIFFRNEIDLYKFIDDVRIGSKSISELIDLREIEFFDKNTIDLLREDYSNIPQDSQGAVWIEQEYSPEMESSILSRIESVIKKNNGDIESLWYAANKNERSRLKEFRHKIALKVNDIISSRGLVKVGTDTAVPDVNFKIFYDFTKDLIENNNIDYVVYGHIGNSHLHFNMLPKTRDELEQCRKLYGQICRKSVQLGGTISAEHGIGKLKTRYLLEMFGESNILQMAKLKKVFDPNIILNIGNIFEEKYLKMV
jgi:D-lactate dehydrogenase (cytochrome)